MQISLSKTTLWKIVKSAGFTFRKRLGHNKGILCERSDLVASRSRYLRQVREKRKEGFDIVYIDETWVNAHHTKEQEWQSIDATMGRHVPSSKGQRLIIAHAGSSNVGFVSDAALIFQSKSTDNRDYHSEMNADIFEDWMKHQLLPALDRPTCIVMDNATYHNRVAQENKTPTSAWRKDNIKEWLCTNSIEFPEHALKPELLQIVKSLNRPKIYAIDKVIAFHGHTSLRLPPYHSHLNPIELVWARIKHDVADKNMTFKIADIKTLTTNAIFDVDRHYWKKCVEHVMAEENNYWKTDGLGFIQQKMVINPFGSDSEDDQ